MINMENLVLQVLKFIFIIIKFEICMDFQEGP